MYTRCALIILMVTMVAFAPIDPETLLNEGPFLMSVSEEQQAEITVSQLAIQRAENERVKDFSTHMIDEHMKTAMAVERLALQQHVVLHPGLNRNHEKQIQELSRLTGHDFDLAYMNHIVTGHDSTVSEWERHAQTLPHPDIKQWINDMLPVVTAHREKARLLQTALRTHL